MPQGPAARITDKVVHPAPPGLMPGPASKDVIIGKLLAWRGVLAAAAAALQGPKQVADAAIKAADAAATAAAGTPTGPAVKPPPQPTKAPPLPSITAPLKT